MMGRLSKRDQALFAKAVAAVAQHDVEGIKSVVLSIGKCRGKVDHAKLYIDIDEMLSRYGDADLGGLDLGQLMNECMDIAREHKIAMPEGVSMLGRGVLTIEGVIADLSPDTNVISIATARAANMAVDKFDVGKELRSGARFAAESFKKAMAIPGLLSDSLKSLSKGQTRVGLDLKVTDESVKAANNLMGKFIAGLLAFGLLLSSSILCTTEMEPKLLGIPALGALGYAAAVGLTVWVFVKISKNE